MSMFDRRWMKLIFSAAVFGFSLGGATLSAQDQNEQAAASRPMLDDEKKDDDKSDAKKEDSKDDELTLEKLFPKKSPFGPSASRTSFSHDGRYGSYMYRPRNERRHGNDIFLYDFETGETHRITSVSKMAEFHSSVRKVKEDRVKKAKATLKKKSDDAKEESSKEDSEDKDDGKSDVAKEEKKDKGKKKGDKENKEEEESDEESKDSEEELIRELKEQGDWVSDKDADDEKAPRYSGVSSYSWAHNGHEMLVSSQGDIFRVKLTDDEPNIERLTRTAQFERSIRYLPDDSGYMYMADDKLYRVAFGKSFVEQIDPKLPSGETMRDYELSPDGSRLVLVSTKGDAPFSSERKIKIVNYRNRFAEVREFSRVVADDPKKSQDIYVRFYDLKGHRDESSKLVDVHHHKLTGPRDVFSTPQWSLDSNRVVFAKFDQASAQIHVLTADFPEKEESDAKKDEAKKSTTEEKKDDDSKDEKKELAKIVHRSLHNGGPNTPRMVSPQFLADHRHVVLLSEQSGYRHLYLLDPVYETMTPLTSGSYEVYPQDLSEDRKWMLVTSTKDHAARQQVYRINLETKEFSPLSQLAGSYSSAAMSGDGQRLLANYVTFGKATELVRVDLAKEKESQINLTDSHTEATRKLIEPIPEFFEYENRHGHTIHGQMFKPDDWKKGDKRPLLIYVYGGPLGDRKMVVDGSYSSDSYFFAYYMAKKHGYVTVTIDPRGVSGYGGLFEKSNFDNIGRPQVEDLSDGVKYLMEEVGVNPNKVGIHGWSFGGFQTQMCMYLAPKVFQVGIAGAGPTEWENYNAWYTTGTVSESREGQTDQDKYSLLKLAKNLEGKMLLVHGMEDSNVLYQDTVRVYRELLKAGKETLVELFLDPTGGHSLGGDVKRLGRMKKYEEFLVRTLGSRPPKKPAGDKAADSSKKDAGKEGKSKEDSAKGDSKKDVDKKKDDAKESGEVDGDKRDSENEAKKKARRAKRKQKGGRKKKDDKSEGDGDKDE